MEGTLYELGGRGRQRRSTCRRTRAGSPTATSSSRSSTSRGTSPRASARPARAGRRVPGRRRGRAAARDRARPRSTQVRAAARADPQRHRRRADAPVPELIESPSRVEAAGTKPKLIDEFVGRVNTGEERAEHRPHAVARGLARARPAPRVRRVHASSSTGACASSTRTARSTSAAGQAVLVRAGEWVRYSTPEAGGAHYVAVCLPAFSPDTVHRDERLTARSLLCGWDRSPPRSERRAPRWPPSRPPTSPARAPGPADRARSRGRAAP